MNWEVRTMRSVTSWFNPTLYRKNITRFWPLWGLYLFCGLCTTAILLLQQWMTYGGGIHRYDRVYDIALDLPEMLPFLVWVSLFYCVMCAMAVYGYLYNHRSACGIHAMPMSRTTLFCTNYLSGLSFFLLPNLVITLITAVIECALIHGPELGFALGRLALVCAVLTGVELFFFGFASLCGMVTGNTLALPAFYAIFNGLALGLYSIAMAWMRVIYYGVQFHSRLPNFVMWLTPVYTLTEACNFERYGEDVNGVWQELPYAQQHLTDPAAVAIYAVVGILLSAAALLLYRRRHMESAGDVVAFRHLFPLFRFGVGACSALTGGAAMTSFFSLENSLVFSTLCAVLWAAVGYFAAEMLLQKSFRVWKQWKGYTVLLAFCVVVSTCVHTDIFGIESKVPACEEVESVRIYVSPTYPDYMDWVTLAQPEQIQAVIDTHQLLVNDLDYYKNARYDGGHEQYAYIDVEYILKDGSTMSRYYNTLPLVREELEDISTLTGQLNALLRDPQIRNQSFGMETLLRDYRVDTAEVEYYDSAFDRWDNISIQEDTDLLWRAVQMDFQQGTLGNLFLFDPDLAPEKEIISYVDTVTGEMVTVDRKYSDATQLSLHLHFLPLSFFQNEGREQSVGYRTFRCVLTPDAQNTIQALELLGCDLPSQLS